MKETEMKKTIVMVEQILRIVENEKRGFKERVKKYEEIKSSSANLISMEFKKKLKTGRNWKGKIEIDYENQKVLLHVVPTKGVPCTIESGNALFSALGSTVSACSPAAEHRVLQTQQCQAI
jgi:metal-dependent hydrolase (beta-lactamase superfamily II)